MDYIELVAIVILIAAIVFLIYYYIQTAREGNINIKEVLNFSPKETDSSLDLDEEMKEKVQKASDAAIRKKDKVIKHIRAN